MQNILINIALVSALIVIGEIIARITPLKASVLRKGMHVAAGFVIMLGASITDYRAYVVVGLYIAAVLMLTRKFLPLQSVQDRFHQSYGEVYFAFGITLTAVACQSITDFLAVVGVLTIADTAAYVAGRSFRSPLARTGKTLAGTLACFLAAASIFLLLGYSPALSIIAGIYATLAELLGDNGSDNITMPIVCVVLLAIV